MDTCTRCDGPVEAIWATYHARTTDQGTAEATTPATATLRLPMTRCPSGHIEGWRPHEDFLSDLAVSESLVAGHDLTVGAIPVKRSWFGRCRCGACGERLALRETGGRTRGTVSVRPPGISDEGRIDVDLPEVACSTCGARPRVDLPSAAGTRADLHGWLYQLFADAMPPDDAAEVEPRT